MIKYLFSFIAGFAGAILFTLLYNHMYNQSIGVVRMDELVGSHIKAEGINEMSTERTEQRAQLFSVALDSSINAVAEEYHVILLVSPAIVSSVPDYTDIVKQRIKQRLNANE